MKTTLRSSAALSTLSARSLALAALPALALLASACVPAIEPGAETDGSAGEGKGKGSTGDPGIVNDPGTNDPGAVNDPGTTDNPGEKNVTACGQTTVRGVDVSQWNDTIGWTKVKSAGISFAFIKATQGSSFVDPQFSANWSGAKSAGVIRGAYHFFDPTVDGAVQAKHYLQTIGTLGKGDLPPALDLECPDGGPNCLYEGGSGWAPGDTILHRVLQFLQTVEQATGKKPIIYSYYAYFDGAGVSTTGLKGYPLWQAMINPSDGCFSLPSSWTKWTLWQNSWHGSVNGINGEVDTDYFNGSLQDLINYSGGPSSGGGDSGGTTSASCPLGDGLYCGQHGISGSSLKLYNCKDGVMTTVKSCALGCEYMPDGQDDQCASGSTCPQGDGLYCGGHEVGGTPTTLYQCTGGVLSKVQSCSNGCEPMADGLNDKCL